MVKKTWDVWAATWNATALWCDLFLTWTCDVWLAIQVRVVATVNTSWIRVLPVLLFQIMY